MLGMLCLLLDSGKSLVIMGRASGCTRHDLRVEDIVAMMLLKSWAIPAASCPTAANRSCCCICCRRRFTFVFSAFSLRDVAIHADVCL
jgi:hypothetical protein